MRKALHKDMPKLSYLEIFLIQFVAYLSLWIYDDYMGSLVSVVMAAIFAAVWLLSLVVEWIEPSKVPRSYFYWIGLSVLAPLLAMLVYVLIMGGDLDWLAG